MSRKVAIMTPAYNGQIHISNAQSVASALFHLNQRNYTVGWLHYGNVASVTKARNALVCEALETGFDDLVFIDSDIAFAPEMLERLLSHDLDMVAGVQQANVAFNADGEVVKNYPYAVQLKDGKIKLNQGVGEVENVSTAFLRLRAPAVRDLIKKVPHLKYADPQVTGWENWLYALFEHRMYPHPTIPGARKYHGEDYSFCQLWKEHGGKIYADMFIQLRHIKSVNLDGHPMKAMRQLANTKEK